MGDHAAIQLALETAGITTAISRVQNLSGGCIHTVVAVTLADGASVVAKINDSGSVRLFEEESHSLRALRKSGAVLTPEPLLTGVFADRAVLLMSHLKPAREHPAEEHWRQFGRELAALHSADAGSRYGFDQDNHIGSTSQPNSWHDDWVEFNAVNRLGYQIALASDNGLLESEEARLLEAVIDRLDRYIPRYPRPSLLHGDLWSGNAIPCTDDSGKLRIAVIDPACSIGDGWADIAMMRLFGGFPRACFEVYEQIIKRPDDVESRLAVYTLYHVLNHVNIFGRGYISQAIAKAGSIARAAMISYEAVAERAVSQARAAYVDARMSADIADLSRHQVIVLAEENLQLAEATLKSGQDDVSVLLSAQQALVEARQALTALRLDAAMARIELEYAVGGRLSPPETLEAKPVPQVPQPQEINE